MNIIEDNVRQRFGLLMESIIAAADELSPVIASAGQRLVDSLLADGKILIAGHGPSCANGLHFSVALLNRFDVERPALPAIDLTGYMALATGCAQDSSSDQVLSRQILALGQEQDVVVLLTTNGQAASLLHAVDAAHEKGLTVIALTGQDGGALAAQLGPNDIEIRVQRRQAAHIREIHLFILHGLCDVIDHALFGHESDVL